MKPPRFDTHNEDFAKTIVGKKARTGIDGFLGVTVTELGQGTITAEFAVQPEHVTHIGAMHGGCLAALVDHTLGIIMYPVMPPSYWAATTEFKVNYLAPVKAGTCVATGRIVSMTKRMAVVLIEVENDGRAVCVAQGTCTIVAPKTP